MFRKLILVMGLFAMGAGSLLPYALPQAQVGTIEGTIVRLGTTDPIPEVQITVGTGGAPVLGQRQAQAVLDASAGGNSALPAELVQAAQNALRGGARGASTAPLRAVSDSAGHFVISDVPVGNTVVRAQLQGYFGAPISGNYPASVSSEVTVTAQQIAQVRLSLIPGGTVSGRVLDPAGKPLTDSAVQVLQSVYQNGARTFAVVALKVTDDRGEYRHSRLPPGEYYLSASPRRTPNSSEVPVTTLYPNGTDRAAAMPIVLRAGEELSGMNIQIRTLPGVKVSGKVISTLPAATGQRGQARPTSVVLVPSSESALPDLSANSLIPITADGTFEIPNVTPGSYDLFARAPLASFTGWGAGNAPALATNPWAFGKTTVDARGQSVSDIAVVIRGGFDVTGHLVIDGKPSPANVRIGLLRDDSIVKVTDAPTLNTFSQIMTFQPPIGADGSFTIPLIPEGKYRFQVGVGGIVPAPPARGQADAPAPALPPSLPATAYVADIRQGGMSVYDNGLTLGSEAPDALQVLVNTNGGSIEGVVAGSDSKPVAVMTVVIVPAQNRRQNPALYKNMRSDAQGHFVFGAVPPGEYKVFAWENVPTGAWQNAEFLAQYEQRGKSVSVNPGSRSTVEVGSIR